MSAKGEQVAPAGAGWSRAAAYGLAGLVHLVTAGLLIGALLLVVLGWGTVTQPMLGLILLGLVTQVRPRFGRPAPELPTLRREQAPALYALLDGIADAAGVRHVDIVQLSARFTVRVSAVGIRRELLLELGVPLWSTFTPQQRVAAIAHELGHFAARDIRRGLMVDMALRTLRSSAEFAGRHPSASDAAPTAIGNVRYASVAATATVRFANRGRFADWALWIPGLVAQGVARLLTRLTLPGARCAEFQADAVAARIASTRAATSALRDRRLAGAVTAEVHRLAIATRSFGRSGATPRAAREFWSSVSAHAEGLPDRLGDKAEVPGRDDMTRAAVDTPRLVTERPGLPALSLRIARLSRAAAQPAALTLDARAADAIEDELLDSKGLLARQVIQDCVRS
ncbi:M48 family metalloprotease [Streptomyces sp. NPDC052051]|uniref:M48 family metallopeptidase n=1 Tax=Streptomyces sp. NPDC052051 TaxID=3154649 RepID=UPI003432E632